MHGTALLLPDFALILTGWALRRAMSLGDVFWSALERLVYQLLFPALLFNALARTHIDFATAAPLLLAGFAALAAGMLAAAPARHLFAMSPLSFASQFQCAFRFNTYLGMAVAATLHGAEGIAAMGLLAGSMVLPANLVSVWVLARHGKQSLWRELARNPLVLATLAGMIFNISGLSYPAVLQQYLSRLSEASIALGLLSVGAALKLRGQAATHLPAFYIAAVKLMLVPAVGLLCARLLGLSGVYVHTVVVFGALPSATSAYILAVRMNGDGPAVAWLVSATTLAAMLTLPAWLAIIA